MGQLPLTKKRHGEIVAEIRDRPIQRVAADIGVPAPAEN